MRWLDRGLSLLLILAGVGHTYGVLNFYKNPDTLFWSLTASVLIALLAAINLLRSWRHDRALAAIAAAGSAAYFVITLGFGRLIGDMTDFRVILFGVITLGLTAFGIRDTLRAR
jgi:peptidoglycan/LPS O-acetylase OafA/YrhL